jgi:hypothetical protein
MKIRHLLMTAFVMISMFDGASFALSQHKKMSQVQPPLVQPQAEKRAPNGAIALTDWVRLSGKFYKLRQHLR